MSTQAVRSFSTALVELAMERKTIDQLQTAVLQIREGLKTPELSGFLGHPKIPAAAKWAVVQRLVPPRAPQELINFLKLIIDRHREQLLPQIIDEVVDQTRRAQGYELIELISGRALSDQEQQAIVKRLDQAWGVKLFAKYREKPDLVGGIIIRRGDQLCDGSLLGQLQALRENLLTNTKLTI